MTPALRSGERVDVRREMISVPEERGDGRGETGDDISALWFFLIVTITVKKTGTVSVKTLW